MSHLIKVNVNFFSFIVIKSVKIKKISQRDTFLVVLNTNSFLLLIVFYGNKMGF